MCTLLYMYTYMYFQYFHFGGVKCTMQPCTVELATYIYYVLKITGCHGEVAAVKRCMYNVWKFCY
jgi:hypothetical protein